MNYPNELVEAVKSIADAINGEGGGGGSENEINVYEGTMGAPFGNIPQQDFTDIVNAVYNHDIEVHLDIDATSLNMGHFEFNCLGIPDPVTGDDALVVMNANFQQVSGEQSFYLEVASQIIWFGGNLWSALMYNHDVQGNIINMTELGANLPCTTTIYYHPMPEE